MTILAGIAALLSLVGVAQALAGTWLAVRFARRPAGLPVDLPSVTILKPLHGDEPLLEAALETFCRQDYPSFQIVFGVQDPADPAAAVVERLQRRFPQSDITLVQDPTQHGTNRKVGNLMNMLPSARHDVLVIADSDLHVRSDYLCHLMACLDDPKVGLVTTLYAGLPVPPGMAARLGAMQITYGFLPGALLARAMGRQDCLGATMCLRRETLVRIGGFPALADHLADDNVLGRLVAALGLSVRLADTVPVTTVPEATFRALFRHELRWARTIRALVPAAFAASALQYPLAWAGLAVTLSGFRPASLAWFAVAWALRALAATGVGHALSPKLQGLAFSCPVWLLPLRDLISIAVMLVSYASRQVDWRGYSLQADTPAPTVT
jgi:ceramide glucosyltransferase